MKAKGNVVQSHNTRLAGEFTQANTWRERDEWKLDLIDISLNEGIAYLDFSFLSVALDKKRLLKVNALGFDKKTRIPQKEELL